MYNTAEQSAGLRRAGSDRPERPLESIASAAQRVNTAVVYLQGFVARFHGQPDTNGHSFPDPPEPSVRPHSENITRLFDAINRLEAQVSELENIG